jgi:hypothetical protein
MEPRPPILPGSNVDRLRRAQAAKKRATNATMTVALDPRRTTAERRAALAEALGVTHTHPGHGAHRHPGTDPSHTHTWPKG